MSKNKKVAISSISPRQDDIFMLDTNILIKNSLSCNE